MIRAIKDVVKIDKDNFICFSCWNKYLKEKGLNK